MDNSLPILIILEKNPDDFVLVILDNHLKIFDKPFLFQNLCDLSLQF
jgi:hypothetical protein